MKEPASPFGNQAEIIQEGPATIPEQYVPDPELGNADRNIGILRRVLKPDHKPCFIALMPDYSWDHMHLVKIGCCQGRKVERLGRGHLPSNLTRARIKAKKRQCEHGGTAPGKTKSLVANIPQVIDDKKPFASNAQDNKAREQAGKLFNVSGQSVAGAKVILENVTEEEKTWEGVEYSDNLKKGNEVNPRLPETLPEAGDEKHQDKEEVCTLSWGLAFHF